MYTHTHNHVNILTIISAPRLFHVLRGLVVLRLAVVTLQLVGRGIIVASGYIYIYIYILFAHIHSRGCFRGFAPPRRSPNPPRTDGGTRAIPAGLCSHEAE